MFHLVLGASQSAREIEYFLHRQTFITIEHLLKLYLCKGHSASDHWRQEIYMFIHDVDRIESTKQYPSAEKIYQWTYGKDQDRVTDLNFFGRLVKTVAIKYDVEPIPNLRTCMTGFDLLCQDYFTWLSNELNACGIVDPNMVYRKLESIGL